MPNNQRENRRKSKKEYNAAKTRRIIWIIIAVVSVALIIMKVVEVDFNSVKRRFVDDNGSISINLDTDVSAYPYQLDSSSNTKMYYQNDKLSVLTSVSCTVLNPKDASVIRSFNHGYSNPFMRNSGNYICTFDQGGRKLRLDSLREGVYEQETEGAVLTADVSASGTVIYAERSEKEKSRLTVINRSLNKLLELNVNDGYIVNVAIDKSGKKCAYAAVNTDNGRLVTTVNTINAGDKKVRASFPYEGSNILDLSYCEGDLYIVGDDFVNTVTSQKRKHEALKQGEANTVCFSYTKDGELIYVYSDYSSANENHLLEITVGGRTRKKIELNQRPKAVTSVSNEICVLNSDRVKIYSLTSGDEKESYRCDSSVNEAYKLSTKVFVSRSQQIDVLK